MSWLIVGLGNPGAQYDKTRHNIGFEVLDRLAQRWNLTFKEERRYQGWWASGTPLGPDTVYLLKPKTYMNRSGQSVRAAVDWLKLSSEQVLVIYDEMALPVGRLRLRKEGSAGGHNGVKSLIQHLGTQNFPRLRLGVGQPPPEQDTVSYVLGRFTPDQRSLLPQVVEAALDATEYTVAKGLDAAMNLYNAWQP
ncbi:aminoacyl-tRNA hydrolase [Anthocerotibacter panamensis]|uniref:aminoacyl-tRNA hydrolase n=1 Tax=Anthocerotibacter panamensis TaxID=2857077 RepID=UPI001C407938|nr:aminoacyl-tRNA hydrolase [Anthocerotibacter panamensis]